MSYKEQLSKIKENSKPISSVEQFYKGSIRKWMFMIIRYKLFEI